MPEPIWQWSLFARRAFTRKRLSRADVIILTHADEVNSEKISGLKKQLHDFDQNRIFCGRHKQAVYFYSMNKKLSARL